MFNDQDQRFMARAIELAERGLYTTAPNPRVGCVLVKDGQVIGEGWHQRAGEGHAEVNAIASVSDRSLTRGATVYVTLEPCSHTGKTPPCCQALITAGVGRVVSAMQDPNPQVSGRGHQVLQEAGISVASGLLEAQAAALNPGFIKRMQTGLPWLRLKLAMSLDGRTAMASGESQWITGPAARADVQRLRARSCAVVTGIGTIVHDNAALTVRAEELQLPDARRIASRQPLRVVLDSSLKIAPSARIFQQQGPVLIVAANDFSGRAPLLQARGAEVVMLPGDDGKVDLQDFLRLLAGRQCNEVMVEAGSTLAAAFWQQGLVDAITVYMAPTLLGSRARPLLELPLDAMSQQQRLLIDGITPVGDDWRIDARPADRESN